jgi:hypothetical protein
MAKTRAHKDGSIEFLDENGDVEAVSRPKTKGSDGRNLPEFNRPKSDYDFRWKTPTNGKPMLVPADTDPNALSPDWSIYKNKWDLCLEIAMEVANGASISKLGNTKGFPSTRTIFYWRQRDEEFRKMLEEAERCRGEFYRDKLANVAESVEEENARSSKVKADIYKHLMAVDDKERFGQAKSETAAAPAINIIFQTGIQRDEPIPVEGNVIPVNND